MRAAVGFTALLLCCFFTHAAGHTGEVAAERQSVKPGINDSYLSADLNADEWVARFEVESREVFRARFEIVDRLQLAKGERVADVGTGTGLFVKLLSEAVGPEGWVYAVDIAPRFLGRVCDEVDANNLGNVSPVLCGQDDIRLPPCSVDAVFVCDTYHHFEYPQKSLASIYRALKPGGRFVVVDFERIPGVSREWTLGHVRAGKEVFIAEIEEAGFSMEREVNLQLLEENYFLRFRKPAK